MQWIWVFPFVFLIFICVVLGLWMWSVFLESAKTHDTRVALLAAFALTQILEFMLSSNGYLDGIPKDVGGRNGRATQAAAQGKTYTPPVQPSWLMPLFLLFNVWGPLDAILRFPVTHDLDSFFAVKYLVILLGKTGVYASYFSQISKNIPLFLMSLFLCIWVQPLLYLMSLPVSVSPWATSDVAHSFIFRDADVLWKWYIFTKVGLHALCAKMLGENSADKIFGFNGYDSNIQKSQEIQAVRSECSRGLVWSREFIFCSALMPAFLQEIAIQKRWIDKRSVRKSTNKPI